MGACNVTLGDLTLPKPNSIIGTVLGHVSPCHNDDECSLNKSKDGSQSKLPPIGLH